MVRGWEPVAIPTVPAARVATDTRWRALLGAFITARPSILRQVPADIVSQGRAWPSPRTWDRAALIAAACQAAGADKAVSSVLVAGLVGHGAAIEFLRFADTTDLPDPEVLLEDPTQLVTDARSDLMLAALAGVSIAVTVDCTEQRWHAAWDVLGQACSAGRADMAAVAALGLLELRRDGWSVPAAAASFAPVLRAAELV
jgi:hypothetical protein